MAAIIIVVVAAVNNNNINKKEAVCASWKSGGLGVSLVASHHLFGFFSLRKGVAPADLKVPSCSDSLWAMNR